METEKSIYSFNAKTERNELVEFIKTLPFQEILEQHAAVKNYMFYLQLTIMHHEYFEQGKQSAAEQLADDLALEKELSDYVLSKNLDWPDQFSNLAEERLYIGAETIKYKPNLQMDLYGHEIFESMLRTAKSQNETIQKFLQMTKL